MFSILWLLVEDGVMRDRGFAVGFGRNAGGDAALGQGGGEPVGVVTLVGQRSCLAFGMADSINAAPL
jgi:hypothetical protein